MQYIVLNILCYNNKINCNKKIINNIHFMKIFIENVILMKYCEKNHKKFKPRSRTEFYRSFTVLFVI